MLIYVACWPLLAYLAGNLIPAIGSGDLSKVSSIIIKSLFVFLVQKTAQFGQDVFIAKPSLEISEVMRGNLFSRIQKIKMNSVENISAGDITYRLTEDADRVSEVIYKTAQDTIPCTLQLLAVIIYMFYLDWSLTLSTFVLAPLIILSVNSFGRRVLIASEKSQESTSNLAGLIGESINGMSTIRAFAAENWIEKRFYKRLSTNKKAKYKTLKLLAFQHPVVGFVEAFGILAILGLGAARINLGLLTSEEFSSFFAAILMLIDPISHVSTNFNDYKQAEASIKRLKKINQEPIEDDKENLKRISNIEGKISFRKVNFEYKKDNQILKNINLDIKKGEVTAFVGASGAGKSTMMALILKFITPKNGDIFIDDKNLKLLNTKDIRKNIALVQQQPFLFSGKIIDVIRMGRNFTKEEVTRLKIENEDHNRLKRALLEIFKISSRTKRPEKEVSLKPFILLFDEYYTDLYRMRDAERWMMEADKMVFIGTSFSVNITSIALRLGLQNRAKIEIVDPEPIDLGIPSITYHGVTAEEFISSCYSGFLKRIT